MQAEVAQGRPKLFVQSCTELISEPRLEHRHSNSQAHYQIVVTILLPKRYSQSRSEMIISQVWGFSSVVITKLRSIMTVMEEKSRDKARIRMVDLRIQASPNCGPKITVTGSPILYK